MTDSQTILFIVTSLIVIATPGQDFVLVMSRGISQGSKYGVATAAGVSSGLIVHTALTAFGIGTLLLTSDIIFSIIKYLGAVYLFYLGYKLLTSETPQTEIDNEKSYSIKKCFLTGAISNITNPKITIFYFAYLPQFIPVGEETTSSLFILGFGFAVLTFLVKGPLGYAAGKSANWIQSNQSFLRWFNRTSGAVLIGLGLKLAFESQ